MNKVSFPPIIDSQAQILILGSLPGDKSLSLQAYYGHPQNRFWNLIFSLLDLRPCSDYTEKIAYLQSNHIALWDVCASANRPGSLDSKIQDVIPNPIPELLAAHPQIQTVFFNGQKAEKLFDNYFQREPKLQYFCLPSSSPANALFNLDKLLKAWQQIATSLGKGLP